MGKRTRPETRRRFPVVNGIFYPENREILTGRLASWGLKRGLNTPSFGGQVIIAPHGAWDISGNIAGAAFAAVQERKTGRGLQVNESLVDEAPVHGGNQASDLKVILLGPCHGYGEEGIYLSDSGFFETPLGNLSVDQKLNRELASCSTLIRINDIPHLMEHSLEVLLPFVKYCAPNVRIVPILVSGGRPALISGLSRALKVIVKKNMEESLLVISSNVSQNPNPAHAHSMADDFCSLLSDMDTGAFIAGLTAGRISACGAVLVAALLESGLLDGRHFSALSPLTHSTEENGEIIYYGAFAAG